MDPSSFSFASTREFVFASFYFILFELARSLRRICQGLWGVDNMLEVDSRSASITESDVGLNDIIIFTYSRNPHTLSRKVFGELRWPYTVHRG